MKSTIFAKSLRAAFFFAFPFLSLFMVEWIIRGSAENVGIFLNHNPGIAVFSYFWLLFLQSFLFSILGRFSFWVFSVSLAILANSHAEKVRTLSEPLYFTDLFAQASQLGELAKFAGFFSKPSALFSCVAVSVLALSWIAVFWNGWRVSRKFRFSAIAALAVVNLSVFFNAFGTLSDLQKITGLIPEEYSWRQLENYETNGFVWGFFTNLGNVWVRKPAAYSTEAAAMTEKSYASENSSKTGSVTRPNVVVILSESFWDATKLPGVEMSEDPVPNYRKIKKEFSSGELISPTFWWKTALVEFELLSGTSVSWLPKGSIPYQQYVRSDIPSVVWEFRKNGYSTTAVHTYPKSFFNRVHAYPHLGFEKFVGIEDMPDAKTKGKFVSDETLTDYVLSAVKEGTPEKPAFVFAISMENHFSYEGDKFLSHDIDVKAPALSESDVLTLKNYVQGIHDADAQLWRLVKELNKLEEPTYVLFFWDHLGVLGDAYRIYEKTGFVSSAKDSKWGNEEKLSMYSPPFLVWNNLKKYRLKAPEPVDFGRVRTPFVGNRLLDILWFEGKAPVFNFLTSTESCFPPTSAELKTATPSDSSYVSPASGKTAPVDCSNALNDWKTLQYRSLFDTDR